MKTTLPKNSEKPPSAFHKSSQAASWFSALKQSLRAALHIDRSQLTAFQAIPGTIGVLLPLSVGVATGHVVVGVSVAGGAAILGSVGLTYTYRARSRTLLLDCLGIALAAFVGSITGHIAWLAVLAVGVWGFGAGMLVAVSQPALVIGLQSTLTLIILTHFQLDPVHAVIQAALMFAGALLQTLLATIPSPWKNTSPERSALIAVYQKLANYAENPSDAQSGQVRDALLKAQSTLGDSNTRSQQGEIFSMLLEEAEHIRLSLMLLTRSRQALKERGPALANSVEQMDRVLQSAAEVLRRTAGELKSKYRLSKSPAPRPRQPIKAALSGLRQLERAPGDEDTIQHALLYGDKLRDQLHRAKKLAKSWKYAHRYSPLSLRSVPRQAYLQLNNTRAIIQANLTPHSATFRHAMRLGVALALATTLYLLFPNLLERGYWIPLTALLVLRSDFASTFSRGLARMLGTMLGAVLAALLASFLAQSQGILVVLDIVALYLAYSILFANYAIFSVFITMEVVFLLSFITPQPPITAAYRAIDTAIGGLLALIIYMLWPTWERSQVRGYVADRLEAIRHYLVAVMECFAHPDAYSDATLHNLRKESRLSRSNAVASVQRAQQEPQPYHTNVEIAHELLAIEDKMVGSALALEAYLLDNPSHHALPGVTEFSHTIDEALRILATSIRNGQPPAALSDLHAALHALEKSGNQEQQVARTDLHFVVSEAKRIVSTTNAINQLLSIQR
jgi:uncharacterized membrane protein YccC